MTHRAARKLREIIYYEQWQDGPRLPVAARRAIATGEAAFMAYRAANSASRADSAHAATVPHQTARCDIEAGWRRSRRSVFWITDYAGTAKPRRPHRPTGQPRGRPPHDDSHLVKAVYELQRVFGVSAAEAVRFVASTVSGDEVKRTARNKTAMRERLRRKEP